MKDNYSSNTSDYFKIIYFKESIKKIFNHFIKNTVYVELTKFDINLYIDYFEHSKKQIDAELEKVVKFLGSHYEFLLNNGECSFSTIKDGDNFKDLEMLLEYIYPKKYFSIYYSYKIKFWFNSGEDIKILNDNFKFDELVYNINNLNNQKDILFPRYKIYDQVRELVTHILNNPNSNEYKINDSEFSFDLYNCLLYHSNEFINSFTYNDIVFMKNFSIDLVTNECHYQQSNLKYEIVKDVIIKNLEELLIKYKRTYLVEEELGFALILDILLKNSSKITFISNKSQLRSLMKAFQVEDLMNQLNIDDKTFVKKLDIGLFKKIKSFAYHYYIEYQNKSVNYVEISNLKIEESLDLMNIFKYIDQQLKNLEIIYNVHKGSNCFILKIFTKNDNVISTLQTILKSIDNQIIIKIN